MLFKRVDVEPEQNQVMWGLGARLRKAFGQTPVAVLKAVKLRPAKYDVANDVNYEANAVSTSLKI